ncbi:hypothetical protein DRA42_05030 [Ethanoligenens harbinense]|nr:hypothetical protein CXQ68_05015 [Ethanoligenens harbinense YUAN-3]AYF38311.1 hypothetical protein CXP51_04875 [Ethanoligenens harbinense]QCN91888.1 hypothetical protein DRA42_05030 [Ethanoligenens harbinense]
MLSIIFDILGIFDPAFRNPVMHTGRVAPDDKPSNIVATIINNKSFEKYIATEARRHIFIEFIAYPGFSFPAMKFDDILPKNV